MFRLAILPAALLAACNRPAPSTTTDPVQTSAGAVDHAAANAVLPTPAPSMRDLTGHWIGVEGLVLDVTSTTPGVYQLAMQYDLDHKGVFAGRAQGQTIAFERDGKTLTLRPTDGDATGLKYLAGKKDCLTVAPGEGYCRD